MDIIYNEHIENKFFNELNFGDCFRLDNELFIKIPYINTKNQDLIGFTADEINCINLKTGFPDYVCPAAEIEIPYVKIVIN